MTFHLCSKELNEIVNRNYVNVCIISGHIFAKYVPVDNLVESVQKSRNHKSFQTFNRVIHKVNIATILKNMLGNNEIMWNYAPIILLHYRQRNHSKIYQKVRNCGVLDG